MLPTIWLFLSDLKPLILRDCCSTREFKNIEVKGIFRSDSVMTDVHWKETQRANVLLLWKVGTKASEISYSLQNVPASMPCLHGVFSDGSTTSKPVAQTSPKRTEKAANFLSEAQPDQQVEALVQENARVTLRKIADRSDSPTTKFSQLTPAMKETPRG